MTSHVCHACKKAFNKKEYALQVGRRLLFHQECFQCVDCIKDMMKDVGSVEERRCGKCQRKISPTVCYECEKPIEEQFYKRVANRNYHTKCFVCDGCQGLFEGEKECYPVNEKYFCLACHYDRRSDNFLRESVKQKS